MLDETELDDKRQIDDPPLLTRAYIAANFPEARIIKPQRYQGIDWKRRPFRSRLVYYGAIGRGDQVYRVVVRATRREKEELHARSFRAGDLRWSNLRTEMEFTSIPYVHVEVGAGFRVVWNAALVGKHEGSKQWILYWFGEKPR